MNQEEIIRQSILEDVGDGDHSSLACIDAGRMGKMKLLVKQDGILAGVEVAKQVLAIVDPTITMEQFMHDGDAVKVGDVAFIIHGPVRSMLTAERTLLNFMQRMSGIATTARHYADRVAGTHATILDTRKTTPNMRIFEKYAVKVGGASNHRFGLFDMVMLKDNHIDFAGGIEAAIDRTHNYLKAKGKDLKIEIEVRDLDELQRVLDHGGVDRIMLDNFDTDTLREAVRRIDHRYETEASGGITEATLRAYAETGVDFISVGALTHHIKSLDISLVKK